jgi:hypothetical protein
VRLAIDNDMSALARLVKIVLLEEKTYDIAVGAALTEDRDCAPQTGGGDRCGAWSPAGAGERHGLNREPGGS